MAHWFYKVSAASLAILPLLPAGAAHAATIINPPVVGPATWSYEIAASKRTGPSTIVSTGPVTGGGTIAANGAPVFSNPLPVDYGVSTASAGGAPYAYASAEASVSMLNAGASAYTTLTYQWLFYNPLGIVTSSGAPVVTISGVTDVRQATAQSQSFAAINVASGLYTGGGMEGDDTTPDTATNLYREVFHGCGISSISDVCGEAPFAIRAMFSFIGDTQMVGYVQLRAVTNAATFSPVGGNAAIPTQTGYSFIDPIISFDNIFLANNAAGQLFLSSGIANASLLNAGVPEMETWAMMLLGAGSVGAMMRRQRKVRTHVSFA